MFVISPRKLLVMRERRRMSFRDKGVRKACWDSRDRYWACLDLPGIQRDHCLELRRLYELACPGHWVKHFDRKRQYMEFQERIHSTTGASHTVVVPHP
ncbi:cytochrome c oxidase assembly factor 6 homolog isoform X4 [Portunus trituberculatus]|uniref:cytochrome c oxidase assembly factor 6 homolog isoform X4 n=1 Tax=Portunus trituberculatus TaxID=210409 RepID=UPI001E1CC437|nr:cytochrome c oxidase assembly factor 6 homolog isoform X4 [Portunus trituberculatus]